MLKLLDSKKITTVCNAISDNLHAIQTACANLQQLGFEIDYRKLDISISDEKWMLLFKQFP